MMTFCVSISLLSYLALRPQSAQQTWFNPVYIDPASNQKALNAPVTRGEEGNDFNLQRGCFYVNTEVVNVQTLGHHHI